MGWQLVVGTLAVLMLVVLLVTIVFLLRIRTLLNHPTGIQITYREEGHWHNAVALLNDDSLDIYPTKSLSVLPRYRWDRHAMSFQVQRPRGGVRIVTIILPDDSWQVAAGADEMSALLSWMDSSRPESVPSMY